jgi:transcription initiation factor TFIID subunit TAF12
MQGKRTNYHLCPTALILLLKTHQQDILNVFNQGVIMAIQSKPDQSQPSTQAGQWQQNQSANQANQPQTGVQAGVKSQPAKQAQPGVSSTDSQNQTLKK